jgi:hypothetical protein
MDLKLTEQVVGAVLLLLGSFAAIILFFKAAFAQEAKRHGLDQLWAMAIFGLAAGLGLIALANR